MHHFKTELRTGEQRRPLNQGWHLRLLDGPAPARIRGHQIPATFPGSIPRDLATAGMIPASEAEASLEWINICSWEYTLDFPFRKVAASPVELVLNDLGAAAEIQLNGHCLERKAHLDSGLRDIGSRLFHGLNNLKVSVQPSLR